MVYPEKDRKYTKKEIKNEKRNKKSGKPDSKGTGKEMIKPSFKSPEIHSRG